MIYFEVLILIIILGLQFYFFNRSRMDILSLRNFFPAEELNSDAIIQVEYQDNNVEQIDIEYSNREFNKVLSATNSYLMKNKGSADFNIIKSIADRSVDAQENKVSSSVSLPLYLGLMGTFTGVILGLGSIALKGFNLEETDLVIRELITGVIVAMIVSLIGLALTTILNAFLFKDAIADRDIKRNLYFNFLQVELLPNLDNNLFSALDQFKLNVADFNTKFSKNLNFFDTSFNENIKNLKATVLGMSEQITAVNENTTVQLEFLQELRKIGYNRMAEANIRVFDKIKEAGPLLVTFIKEQQKLTLNMEQANNFSEKISGLMDRVSSFEEGINNLGRDLQQSDILGADMLGLVKKHLTAIEQKESLVQDYAAKSNHELESYLAHALERIKSLKSKIEIDFEKAFDFDAEDNLMQNLKYLKLIDKNTTQLTTQFAEKNNVNIENKVDQVAELIKQLLVKSESRQTTIHNLRESIEKPEPVKVKNKWYQFGKSKAKK